MKKRSLRVNALLYAIRAVMSFVFPFITFPYLASILGVANIGKVTTSANIVNYFVLISQMGILSYGMREGARIRDDRKQLSVFASEIFTINILFTVLAYALLVITVMLVPHLRQYSLLILIQSFNIIGATIGVEWMCSIFEDYGYVAVRSLAVQVMSVILIFTLVKQPQDYPVYAAITVATNAGANLMNFFHVRKFADIHLTGNMRMGIHLKPMVIIFSSAVATTIYANFDVTMLSFMKGDYNVGLYNASLRIYSILQTLVESIFLVAAPRLSNSLATESFDDYKKSVNSLFNDLFLFLMPITVGVFMVSYEVIVLFSRGVYVEAAPSLQILSIALFFSRISSFMTYSILLPNKMESGVLKAMIISAITNVVLNYWAIPVTAQNGAAFTTAIAELQMTVFQFIMIKNMKVLQFDKRHIGQICVACLPVIGCCILVNQFHLSMVLTLLCKVIGSVVLYMAVLGIFRNAVFCNILSGLLNRLHITYEKGR